MFRVCRVFLSVHCSLVVTCSERADLLALLCVMFYCVFITFPCDVLGQMWCLIVFFPDLCILYYFQTSFKTLLKYNLNDIQNYLDQPTKKTVWKRIISEAVNKYWKEISSLVPLYRHLEYLYYETYKPGHLHP